MNEEMKVELEIRDKNDAEDNCSRKRSKQPQEEQQEEEKKKKTTKKLSKLKPSGTGRYRGRPRIHPKKQRMCFTMEDLCVKASNPFGAKRLTRKKEKKSMEDADSAAAADASE